MMSHELYIDQMNDQDVKRYGMLESDYGIFDETGHCYFYGSLSECEARLKQMQSN